jgi:superfamily II RNA helicase
MPAWKLVIEKMMSAGLLNAIFATSTVAAGVDFPARTVVISNADTRGNEGWRPLRASELQQMTGRAGRRGKDKVGFVVLAPGQFQNPRKIAELLRAPPDALESQFRATYTSLLNLLDAFGAFAPVREIAEKSFAFRATRHRIDSLESRRESIVRSIMKNVTVGGVTLSIDDVRGYERLAAAMNRLQRNTPATRAEMRHGWLRQNALPGRVVTKGRSAKRLFIILNVAGERVTAMRDDGQGATFELAAVNRVYEKKYALKEKNIEAAFFDVYEGSNRPLDEPKAERSSHSGAAYETLLAAMQRVSQDAGGGAASILSANVDAAEALERIERDIAYLKDEIWQPFYVRAKVLDHFAYMDLESETVLLTGKWLADLRVDRPLVVGEALRREVFAGLRPPLAAGLMASIAADPERSYGDLYLSDGLVSAMSELDDILMNIAAVEFQHGVEPVEELNSSAAAAAERWAGGQSWEKLVEMTRAEEGDLVRLLSRTGEALLQMAKLGGENQGSANIAREAAELVLREPVR